jgi:hypothetical protein
MTPPRTPQRATTTGRASEPATWAHLVAWVFAVGLLAAEVASVLATSRRMWFGWLSISLALFGGLTLGKLFAARQANVAAASTAPLPQTSNRAWNRFGLTSMTLVLLIGLVKAPHRSKDVFAYGAYGRMVSEHSVSPYTTRPSAFPNDPVIARMAKGWSTTRSVYGPAFTVVSALGMRIAGTSAVIERLWFQTLAAIATGLSALLLKRLSPKYWWLFGLNPVTLLAVAHEGHNDALFGLGILSALWFVQRDFSRRATEPQQSPLQNDGSVNQDLQQTGPRETPSATQPGSRSVHGIIGSVVLAASIKITALVVVPALAVWIFRHVGKRRSLRVGAAWAGVCGVLFAATGGPSAFQAFRGLRTFRSTTSLWHLDLVRKLTDTPLGKPGVLALTLPAVALVATALLIVHRTFHLQLSAPSLTPTSTPVNGPTSEPTEHPFITRHTYFFEFPRLIALTLLPLVIFITLGLYVLPWYWGWVLAPGVLLPARFRTAVMISAAMHTLAYGAGTLLHGTFARVLQLARILSPLAFLVTVVFGLTTILGTRPKSLST